MPSFIISISVFAHYLAAVDSRAFLHELKCKLEAVNTVPREMFLLCRTC